jgi:hypothetical protein
MQALSFFRSSIVVCVERDVMVARYSTEATLDRTFLNEGVDLVDCRQACVPDCLRTSAAEPGCECGEVGIEDGGEVGAGAASVHPTNLSSVEQSNPETLLLEQPRGSYARDACSNYGQIDIDVVRQRLESRQLGFIPDRFLLNF